MAFRVEITARAEAEVPRAFDYIAADYPARAAAWLHGFYDAAESLAKFPERCGIAPENEVVDFIVRQLRYGNYRILFTVEGNVVYVMHMRHAARTFLTRDELGQS